MQKDGKKGKILIVSIIALVIIILLILLFQNSPSNKPVLNYNESTQKYTLNYNALLTNYTAKFAEVGSYFTPAFQGSPGGASTAMELIFSSTPIKMNTTLEYEGHLNNGPIFVGISLNGNGSNERFYVERPDGNNVSPSYAENTFVIGKTSYTCGNFGIYTYFGENLCNGINLTLIQNSTYISPEELSINIANITSSSYNGINCTYGTATFNGGRLSSCITNTGNPLFFKVNYNSTIRLNITETSVSNNSEQLNNSSLPYPSHMYFNYSLFTYRSQLLPYLLQTNYTYSAPPYTGNEPYMSKEYCNHVMNGDSGGCGIEGPAPNGSILISFNEGLSSNLYNVELACATTLTLYGLPKAEAANDGFGALQSNYTILQNNPSGGTELGGAQPVFVSNLNCYNSTGNEIGANIKNMSVIILMNYTLRNSSPSSANNPYYTIEIGNFGVNDSKV